MKPSLAILISLVAGLYSCGENEPSLLIPNLVSSIHAFDLDNNGNSSDIRVDFEVKNNHNVIEYRIMIVPSGAINSFNSERAVNIPEESYVELNPENLNLAYSIKRLPSGLLDVNNNHIQNDIEYVAVVFVFGKDDLQLSRYSRNIPLKDQGIYAGFYRLSKDNFSPYLPGVLDSVKLTSEGNNLYTGQMWGRVIESGRAPHCNDVDIGQISFYTSEDIISDVYWTSFTEWGGQVDICEFVNRNYVGAGKITTETFLEFSCTRLHPEDDPEDFHDFFDFIRQ